MKHLIAGMIFTMISFFANAQTIKSQPDNFYTIQLGTFDPSVKQADFEAIRSYAYIYRRNNVVFAGGFNSAEEAQGVLQQIKAKGYDDAFITKRPLTSEKSYYVIQLATKNAGEPIEWKKYATAGDLFSYPYNSQVRILHGVYEDKNDARVKMNELIARGFSDAFLKTIKLPQISTGTPFESDEVSMPVQRVKVETKAASKSIPVPSSYSIQVTKRKTVVKLQEALRKEGTFTGEADGKPGKHTESAYNAALVQNRRLKILNEVAQKYNGFGEWEDLRLLLTIARDMNPKSEVPEVSSDALLNLPSEPLNAAQADKVLNWHVAEWKKLENWAVKSKLDEQYYYALKIVYYRSLTHLEDFYMKNGLKQDAATALAVSVVKSMIGQDIDAVVQ